MHGETIKTLDHSLWGIHFGRGSAPVVIDLAGKKRTCVLLSILVHYSSSRVSQEPNGESNCSEGRTEIVRGGTVTATTTNVVVFWIITQ